MTRPERHPEEPRLPVAPECRTQRLGYSGRLFERPVLGMAGNRQHGDHGNDADTILFG
jgi:hypothetical protein